MGILVLAVTRPINRLGKTPASGTIAEASPARIRRQLDDVWVDILVYDSSLIA